MLMQYPSSVLCVLLLRAEGVFQLVLMMQLNSRLLYFPCTLRPDLEQQFDSVSACYKVEGFGRNSL